VLVTSLKTPEEILAQTDAAERPYTLAVVPSDPSFAGLWVFKDDHTDYRVLGALARLIPEWLRIEDVKAAILEATSDETKVASAQFGYDRVQLRTVQPGEGTTGHEKLQFEKPGWTTMREGIVVEARKPGERNPFYKKYTARTLRPVVNFDTCIKCTMCWLDCPDECFEVTPSGHYEVVYEACIGCGICAQVCPVKDCIVMIDELNFTDNVDKFALYEQKPDEYRQWFTQMTGLPMPTPAPSAPAATGGE
jgi:pyruvate ferredoxin oxidoreductase delta subunit